MAWNEFPCHEHFIAIVGGKVKGSGTLLVGTGSSVDLERIRRKTM
jgi:hypothetical protein